mmetsp:Transcript_22475/g.33520  ORF Transcript_22475/g.33520 Transcript_22475/m.33520 type:complete len:1427 (+) Transcript_22475:66-4346(+)
MLNPKRPYQIYIHIIEARGVTGLDSTHASDINCLVTIGPTARLKRVTRTSYETNNTLFNEVFVFENVMLTDDEWKREKIGLNVYDRNDFIANERIGGIEFSLENVYRQKDHEYFRKWMPIVLPQKPGKPQGYLRLSLYILKRGDPTPIHDDTQVFATETAADEKKLTLDDPDVKRKIYLLNCFIYRAEGLRATHGKSLNSFISIRFNGQTFQTEQMPTLISPIWNRKISIPFQLPLTSDAIEIQIWNNNSFAPDTMIGSHTISYYDEGLSSRPWGPRWINLYSSDYTPPTVTMLGSALDAFDPGKQIGKDEYVGRLLARLSVKSIADYMNPRTLSTPCAPAVERDGENYVLDFVALSATEIPIAGGKLQLEVCFGPERKLSKAVYGVQGTYKFDEVIEPIEFFATEKLEQVPDVTINLYLVTGKATRKIAFERIPVINLLDPTSDLFYMLNGEAVPTDEQPWHPQVRSLQNIKYSSKDSHLIAGFVSCWIGFGVTDKRPISCSVPNLRARIEEKRPTLTSYTLKFHLHHGTNLPAGNESGTSTPFVVVRFAGKTASTKPKRSRFPIFNETLVISRVRLDPNFSPSVQVLVYHKSGSRFSSPQLLGRFDIQTIPLVEAPLNALRRSDHPFETKFPPLTRYPLRLDSNISNVLTNEGELSRESPESGGSITAQIELIPTSRAEESNTERRTPVGLYLPAWKAPNSKLHFVVLIDVLGLFDLNPRLSPTHLLLYFEGFQDKKDKNTWKIPLSKKSTGNISIMEIHRFKHVQAPMYDLEAVPLHIELRNSFGALASVALPLSEIVGGHSSRPRLYRKRSNKPGRAPIRTPWDIIDEMLNEEKRVMRAKALLEIEKKMKAEQNTKSKVYIGSENDLELGESECLLEDWYSGNSRLLWSKEMVGKGQRDMMNVNLEKDLKLSSESDEADNEDDNPKYGKNYFYTLNLLSGRSVGLSEKSIRKKLVDAKSAGSIQSVAGVLKCIIRSVRLNASEYYKRENLEDEKVLQREKQLDPDPVSDELHQRIFREMKELRAQHQNIYSQRYVVRIYVYNAQNLSPPVSFINDGSSTSGGCYPYLILSNGSNKENKFSSRSQPVDRTPDFNPDFYQVVELPASLPTNRLLKIQVWDRAQIPGLEKLGIDRFVGEARINIEKQIIKGVVKGTQQWRRLHHPKFATARGKINVRVDVLTEEQARIEKTDELTGPQSAEYEFRLVLWQTVGVKFPEEKDRSSDVDQKIRVSVNFSGVPGREVAKETDTAWYAAGGNAQWNWRLLFPVTLPCRPEYARIKFAVWDENLVGSGENVGEAVLNVAPLFAQALQEKNSRTMLKPLWVKFRHPNYAGTSLGQLYVQASIWTQAEASDYPVGEAQNEPNRLPFLANPKRNLPPWAIGSRALDYLSSMRLRIILLLLVLLALVIVTPLIVFVLAAQTGGI